jgi:hypothetical protein
LQEQKKGDDDDDVEKEKVVDAHDWAYNQNQGSAMDAKSMIGAAALYVGLQTVQPRRWWWLHPAQEQRAREK